MHRASWATVCSPCCHLAKDTELSAVIPPDYRVASFLRLGDSSTHPLHNRPKLSSVLQPWCWESFAECGSTVWFSFTFQSVVSSEWDSFLFGHGQTVKLSTSCEPTQATYPSNISSFYKCQGVSQLKIKIVLHLVVHNVSGLAQTNEGQGECFSKLFLFYFHMTLRFLYERKYNYSQWHNCYWVSVDIVALIFLQLRNVTFMPTHLYVTEKVPVFPWCGEGPQNNNLHSSPSVPHYTTDYTSLSWTHPRIV